MKFRILVLISITFAQMAAAQSVSFDKADDRQIYANALNYIVNSSGSDFIFPKHLIIDGRALQSLGEVLAEKSYAPPVKSFVRDSGWAYIEKIDLMNNKNFKVLKTKNLYPSLSKQKRLRSSPGILMSFTPVMYSANGDQAMVVFNLYTRTEVVDEVFFYYVKDGNRWRSVKNQRPNLF